MTNNIPDIINLLSAGTSRVPPLAGNQCNGGVVKSVEDWECKGQICSEMSTDHQAPVPSAHLGTNGQLRSAGDLGLKCLLDNPGNSEAG